MIMSKKNVRLDLTDNEKFARNLSGLESNAEHFSMGSEDSLEDAVAKQKAAKFN
jgi:co-chaperonin GroES (HSP10)/chaperonin cofactor prefoldin